MDYTSPDSDICEELAKKIHSTDFDKLHKEGKGMMHYGVDWSTDRLEGKALNMFVYMMRAQRVLEVGMFLGYGSLQLAEALPANGKLVTLERDPFLKEFAQPFFDKSPHGKKIEVVLGDAGKSMKELNKEEKFDLIFIDADKNAYGDYFDTILERGLLAKNGVIVVDNTFYKGQAYVPPEYQKGDPENWNEGGRALKEFNAKVLNDPRVEVVMLPLRDGVSIIRMKWET